MKIAHIGLTNIGYEAGGLSTYARELLPRFVEKGHEILVYTKEGLTHIDISGVAVKKMRQRPGSMGCLADSFEVNIRISWNKPDVINYHTIYPSAFSFIPSIKGIPTILTLHGNKPSKGNLIVRNMRLLLRSMACHLPQKITVVTDGLKNMLEDTFDIRAEYIPHGASPIPYVEPELISSLGLEKGNFMLYLGRLCPDKGVDLLIRAYNSVNLKRRLVIAGGTSSYSDYVRYIHLLSEDNDSISFTGTVFGRLREELLTNAYVFVSPMKIAGLPLTVLESMSANTCVIASDIDSKEVYRHCMRFRSESISDLADSLSYVESHPSFASILAESGNKYVNANHCWNKTAEKFDKIYRSLE